MAGLVPAIHVLLRCRYGCVRLFHDQSSQRHSLRWRHNQSAARAYQHREGLIAGFTKRFGLKMLVYYEVFDDVRDAIQREKTIKHWPRAWKVRLIHQFNSDWDDLYDSLF